MSPAEIQAYNRVIEVGGSVQQAVAAAAAARAQLLATGQLSQGNGGRARPGMTMPPQPQRSPAPAIGLKEHGAARPTFAPGHPDYSVAHDMAQGMGPAASAVQQGARRAEAQGLSPPASVRSAQPRRQQGHPLANRGGAPPAPMETRKVIPRQIAKPQPPQPNASGVSKSGAPAPPGTPPPRKTRDIPLGMPKEYINVTDAPRDWSSRLGTQSLQGGQLVGLSVDGRVVLRRPDGKTVAPHISELSDQDVQYVQGIKNAQVPREAFRGNEAVIVRSPPVDAFEKRGRDMAAKNRQALDRRTAPAQPAPEDPWVQSSKRTLELQSQQLKKKKEALAKTPITDEDRAYLQQRGLDPAQFPTQLHIYSLRMADRRRGVDVARRAGDFAQYSPQLRSLGMTPADVTLAVKTDTTGSLRAQLQAEQHRMARENIRAQQGDRRFVRDTGMPAINNVVARQYQEIGRPDLAAIAAHNPQAAAEVFARGEDANMNLANADRQREHEQRLAAPPTKDPAAEVLKLYEFAQSQPIPQRQSAVKAYLLAQASAEGRSIDAAADEMADSLAKDIARNLNSPGAWKSGISRFWDYLLNAPKPVPVKPAANQGAAMNPAAAATGYLDPRSIAASRRPPAILGGLLG